MSEKIKAAKIFAIIGIVLNALYVFMGIGIVGLIFNIIALNKIKKGEKPSFVFLILYTIFGQQVAGILMLMSDESEYIAE